MTLKNTETTDKYKITVINNQTIDGETDTITEEANGSFTIKNNKIYIRYKTENGKVSTLIKIDEKAVTINRRGENASVMTYKKDMKTEFEYHTPYGTIPMEIKTEKIVRAFSDSGGRLMICYTIRVMGDKYKNNITIDVTER